MRLLVPVLAFLCCGFTIITDEMIEERAKLCDRIRARYTEEALTAFVKEVSSANPEVDGISLADATVEKSWHTMDWNPFWHVISGDWAMEVEEYGWWIFTRIDRFTMFWACEEDAGGAADGALQMGSLFYPCDLRSAAHEYGSWPGSYASKKRLVSIM